MNEIKGLYMWDGAGYKPYQKTEPPLTTSNQEKAMDNYPLDRKALLYAAQSKQQADLNTLIASFRDRIKENAAKGFTRIGMEKSVDMVTAERMIEALSDEFYCTTEDGYSGLRVVVDLTKVPKERGGLLRRTFRCLFKSLPYAVAGYFVADQTGVVDYVGDVIIGVFS